MQSRGLTSPKFAGLAGSPETQIEAAAVVTGWQRLSRTKLKPSSSEPTSQLGLNLGF